MSKTYTPLEWQINPWKSKAPVLLLTGAAGGGKSRIAGEKLHAYLLKYPGATGVVGRKDRTTAFRSVVPLLERTVQSGTSWGKFLKSDGLFEYSNGSMLWVVGLKDEGQRENLRSIGQDGSVDIAWFEEANKLVLDDHYEITARMRGTAGGFRQIIYSTNPDSQYHWIKRLLIDGREAETHYSRPEHNPYNPQDYIDRLKNLTGVLFQRLWLGQWVQAEGLIYTSFDQNKHVLDRVRYDLTGRFVCSVDFGYTNPFSWSLWYIDHDDVIYQLAQIYKTKTLVEDHAVEIQKELNRLEIRTDWIEAWVCDHDAEDRATLEKHLGIVTDPAYKGVSPGIEAVESRFKSDRLFLLRNPVKDVDLSLEGEYKPTCTAEELPGYVWSEKKPETPEKENDHGCDEMRYLVCYVDQVSEDILDITPSAGTSSYIRNTERRASDTVIEIF